MAKSKAKKLREKIVREGGVDPQKFQSIFTKSRDGFNFTGKRIGKTLQASIEKENKKSIQQIKQSFY